MSPPLEFTVLGRPQSQGSKTRTPNGGFREDNAELRPWRQAVAAAALQAMNGHELYTGPLSLVARFTLRRPAAHYGTGRNAGRLKPSAPSYVRTKPDADKLIRAVADALTGIAYRDDSQLVALHAVKMYGAPERAELILQELREGAA
jgi:crossover junction endodeoxyribonuclease RusA